MATTLRCPVADCRERFPWDVSQGFPRFCPCCGTDIAVRTTDNVISMPAFLTSKSKVPDKVARDYMDGSEQRVHMAAELAGTTSEDMSSLKITDLSDRRDVEANIPVNNPVTQFMQAHPQAAVGYQSNGAEYSTQVQTGPGANTGAKMLTKVRGFHDGISRGTAVSDRPALETQQPGYRRRG